MRRLATMLVFALAAAPAVADVTDPKPAPLVGVTEAARVAIDKGFIDDAIAFDGKQLAFVNTDGATFADLVVYDVAKKAEASRVALPADLGATIAVKLVGDRVLVVGRAEGDDQARAALIAGGKVGRRFGPATDISVLAGKGKPAVVLHRVTVKKGGKGGAIHEVEQIDLDTGKRVGKLRTLELDGAGKNEKLDFRVDYWTAGFTQAMGVKGGHWDPKENQRTPDVAATYSLLDGTFSTMPIDDPIAFAKQTQVLTSHVPPFWFQFTRVSDDLSGMELWLAGKPKPLALDQAFAQYDPKSLLDLVPDERGVGWFVLEVDPTNVDAVKRKKADPQYLDLFAIDDALAGKAVRKARVLATPKKKYATGVAGGMWWLLERSVGYDRGGTSLVVYKLG